MTISRRLRFEVLRRDGYACHYCGAAAPDAVLTVDHVIPVALGGGDDPTNLITACDDCNAGKSSTSPDEHTIAAVDAAAIQFAKAMERASEIHRSDLAAEQAIAARFDTAWLYWKYGSNDLPLPRNRSWATIILGYLNGGLTIDELEANVRIAMESGCANDMAWRYFCGVCKNQVTTRQEIARRLIEDGEV